jgi:hypothetical protein
VSFLGRRLEYTLFGLCAAGSAYAFAVDAMHSPLDFIILNDKLLLQHLDCVQLSRRLFLGKHDFSEITLTENRKEVEVVQANLAFTNRLLRSLSDLQWRLSVSLRLGNLLWNLLLGWLRARWSTTLRRGLRSLSLRRYLYISIFTGIN